MTRDSMRVQNRRGMAVAAVVIVLALIHLVVLGTIRAAGDSAEIDSMRIETMRAFYAAESGAMAVVKLYNDGLALPTSGSLLNLGNAKCEYIELPTGGSGGIIVVEGQSGLGRRRLVVAVQ